MTISRRWYLGAGLALLATGAWWLQRDVHHYVSADPAAAARFVAAFAAPPAANSAATRAELEELLALQARRTPAQVEQARADRKTQIRRFYGAFGLAEDAAELPLLEDFAEEIEDDVRGRVRSVKEHFRRLRPSEVDSRIEPCIDDVRGDLSYPSGHAAFGWAMAWLLAELEPTRRDALEKRAEEFARQRMVCGVHYASDLAAGKFAARLVFAEMTSHPRFQARLDAVAQEYRRERGVKN